MGASACCSPRGAFASPWSSSSPKLSPLLRRLPTLPLLLLCWLGLLCLGLSRLVAATSRSGNRRPSPGSILPGAPHAGRTVSTASEGSASLAGRPE
eukprot:365725-Chlamydomonas_euryale.AAC.48